MSIRRLLIALTSFVLLSSSAFAVQPPAPVGQSEFVPVDSVPLADQLPAAPLLVTAYAFVWVAVMVYLWTIWRRLNKVETEMRALAQKQKTSQR
jgi:hypothetical protein